MTQRRPTPATRTHALTAFAAGRGLLAEAAAAVAVAVAFVCALTWPLAAHLGSRFIGTVGTDAAGGIWWLWHVDRVGYHLFGTSHNPLLAAPFGVEEANWINLQSFVPYAPAALATKVVGEVAAFNLVVIWGLALSGAAMYALVRFLGASRLVAAWAGVVYVVFPAHLVRLEHGSLTHFEVLVLTLLAVVAAAERPTTSRLSLVGAATLVAWATFGYFGAMALVGAATCAVTAAFVVSGRRERLRLAVGAAAAAFLATALFGRRRAGHGRRCGRRARPRCRRPVDLRPAADRARHPPGEQPAPRRRAGAATTCRGRTGRSRPRRAITSAC